MILSLLFAAATASAVPAPAPATVDIGAFTEFPCFENRTKYAIAGYVRTGGGKVEIVPVAPNAGGCLTTARPDPANAGMSVGTAFLDKTSVLAADLQGRDVSCVLSPKAMAQVGFRVVVMEEDSGLFCQSLVLDK